MNQEKVCKTGSPPREPQDQEEGLSEMQREIAIANFMSLEISCNMNDRLMIELYQDPGKVLGDYYSPELRQSMHDWPGQLHFLINNRTIRWPLSIVFSPEVGEHFVIIPEFIDMNNEWLSTPPSQEDIDNKYPKNFPLLATEDGIDGLLKHQLWLDAYKEVYVNIFHEIRKLPNKCHIIYIFPFVDRKVDVLNRIQFKDSEIVLSSCS